MSTWLLHGLPFKRITGIFGMNYFYHIATFWWGEKKNSPPIYFLYITKKLYPEMKWWNGLNNKKSDRRDAAINRVLIFNNSFYKFLVTIKIIKIGGIKTLNIINIAVLFHTLGLWDLEKYFYYSIVICLRLFTFDYSRRLKDSIHKPSDVQNFQKSTHHTVLVKFPFQLCDPLVDK